MGYGLTLGRTTAAVDELAVFGPPVLSLVVEPPPPRPQTPAVFVLKPPQLHLPCQASGQICYPPESSILLSGGQQN